MVLRRVIARPKVFNSAQRWLSVHPSAVIHSSAVLIDPVDVGARSQVGPNAVLGPNCTVGQDCVVGPGCVVQEADIGARVTLHPGVCVGQEGFGFHVGQEKHEKKPQNLKVVIQDDVEIGANSTVDRGSWRDTVIGKGTKLDNLVSCFCFLFAGFQLI